MIIDRDGILTDKPSVQRLLHASESWKFDVVVVPRRQSKAAKLKRCYPSKKGAKSRGESLILADSVVYTYGLNRIEVVGTGGILPLQWNILPLPTLQQIASYYEPSIRVGPYAGCVRIYRSGAELCHTEYYLCDGEGKLRAQASKLVLVLAENICDQWVEMAASAASHRARVDRTLIIRVMSHDAVRADWLG